MILRMISRITRLLAAIALCSAAPAVLAQETGTAPVTTQPPAPQRPVSPAELARVAIVTDLGTITLDLDLTNAPVTSRNFLRYAKEKRFDGTSFYRVMRLDWGQQPNGLIQGGTRADLKRDLPPIAHEPTTQTGIRHQTGAISMARFAPGTAKGDFTIMMSNMSGLDAQPDSASPDLQPGYAAFGRVVDGMDVARLIFDAPISPTLGEGFMRGQMIERPVRIISVRQIARPSAPAADTGPATESAQDKKPPSP